MAAVIYERISKEDQQSGLKAHLDSCNDYATRHRVPIKSTHIDSDISGATPPEKRPAFLEALDALEPGDILLIANRARLGRDIMVIHIIEGIVRKKGAKIVSVLGEGNSDDPDDPGAFIVRHTMDGYNTYERLTIKFRTKMALKAKKRRGERLGQIPYGYSVDPATMVREITNGTEVVRGGKLIPNEDEQAVIERIRSRRSIGWSLRQIAAELNESGIPSRNAGRRTRGGICSGKWSAEAVRSVLNYQHAAGVGTK